MGIDRSSGALGRRGFLGLVAAGMAAGGLRPASADPAASPTPRKRARACILLWMNGGPSHVDTFDPKPKSSGPLRSIGTRAPGLRFSELLPELAEEAGRLAVCRGMTSSEGNHQRALELAHTGHPPNPTARHPAFGAWASQALADPAADLPAYVSLGGPGGSPGALGARHAPFVVRRPGKMPEDARPRLPLPPARQARRRRALAALEGDFARRTGGDARAASRRAVLERADALAASPALDVFDLGGEPRASLEAYGASDFGRGCLVARRLVERGVRFAEVTLDGWDTHEDNFERTRKLCGKLDPAMASLLRDLGARDLLDSTLVVCVGEFGRTPRLNRREGRDHHPRAFFAVMAGGGVRPGVHGETDELGESVVSGALTFPDLYATCAALLGIPENHHATSPLGRPLYLTDGGAPVSSLLAP